eukprot:10454894-Ditylum_brightwellii.AAC.1
MTATETIEWMWGKGILKHWILLEQGLNKGMQYKNASTRNAPEFNALDSSCSCDIYCFVLEHGSYTATVPNMDKCQFSVGIPKRQDCAYLRLWDPSLRPSHPMGWEARVPSSKQILEDIEQIQNYSILKQIEARGVVVHGHGTCRGHREDGKCNVGNWGGSRIKKMLGQKFMHPNGVSADDDAIKESVCKLEGIG